MKTLLVLRHAKSDWGNPALDDHDRPLNRRGKHQAPKVGEHLTDAGLLPELILSSTARRAVKTVHGALSQYDYQGEMRLESSLYAAPPEAYLELLAKLPDNFTRVMVVGHNPGLEELVSDLTGQPATLPTAALAQLELPIESWPEIIHLSQANLVSLWKPEE